MLSLSLTCYSIRIQRSKLVSWASWRRTTSGAVRPVTFSYCRHDSHNYKRINKAQTLWLTSGVVFLSSCSLVSGALTSSLFGQLSRRASTVLPPLFSTCNTQPISQTWCLTSIAHLVVIAFPVVFHIPYSKLMTDSRRLLNRSLFNHQEHVVTVNSSFWGCL